MRNQLNKLNTFLKRVELRQDVNPSTPPAQSFDCAQDKLLGLAFRQTQGPELQPRGSGLTLSGPLHPALEGRACLRPENSVSLSTLSRSRPKGSAESLRPRVRRRMGQGK
jgi:hypothetical protein